MGKMESARVRSPPALKLSRVQNQVSAKCEIGGRVVFVDGQQGTAPGASKVQFVVGE